VLLQAGLERELTPKPTKHFLCFMAQFHLGQFVLTFRCARSGRDLHTDFDKPGRGADAHVHAARRGEFGLVALVFEHFDNGGEVLVGNIAQFANEYARNVAAGQARVAGDIGLPELVPVRDPIQSGAQITHSSAFLTQPICFAAHVSFYATSDVAQHIRMQRVEWVEARRSEKAAKIRQQFPRLFIAAIGRRRPQRHENSRTVFAARLREEKHIRITESPAQSRPSVTCPSA
jgi:hypothetical protein